MILRWSLISIYAILSTILAMILTPFVVFLANRTTGKLPYIFSWMETPDMPLPGDPNIMGKPTGILSWYFTAMKWLWRNPAYRATDFAKFIPGVYNGKVIGVGPDKFSGDLKVSDSPFKPGYFYAELSNGGTKVFDYYRVWGWPGTNKCVRIRLGWKLQPWFIIDSYDPKTVVGMHVISFTPFMTKG